MSSTAAADSAERAPRGAGRARWAWVVGPAVAVLALDQVTKWWAVRRLCGPPFCPDQQLRDPVDVVWTLRMNYAENTGMAFSVGRDRGWIIGLVALGIVAGLLFVARSLQSRLQLALVGVVIGGALGNVVDRLTRAENGFMSGSVVDFIDLQWWPIFNVADTAVVLGGILLAVSMVFEPGERRAEV